MGRNAYLDRVRREVDRRVADQTAVRVQMCLDAAVLAAAEVFNMGPGRVQPFVQAFSTALDEIATLAVEDTADLEYTKAKVDERMKEICGEHFKPWEERYR